MTMLESYLSMKNEETQGRPLVSLLPGPSLFPEKTEVIYASKNQVWVKVVPTEAERAILTPMLTRKGNKKKENIEPIYKIIGTNIRKRRTAMGLSCNDMVGRMSCFTHASSLSGIERGQQCITIHILMAIASILGCSINDLIENGEHP